MLGVQFDQRNQKKPHEESIPRIYIKKYYVPNVMNKISLTSCDADEMNNISLTRCINRHLHIVVPTLRAGYDRSLSAFSNKTNGHQKPITANNS